jgi:hypothetical protein
MGVRLFAAVNAGFRIVDRKRPCMFVARFLLHKIPDKRQPLRFIQLAG